MIRVVIKAVIFDYGGVLLQHFRRDKRLYAYAQNLREQGYATAVLSNQILPIAWAVKTRGDLNPFSPVIVSAFVRVSKPNEKIYRIILDQLALNPNECVFIDNKSRNLEPANRLGIHTVQFKSNAQTIQDVNEILQKQAEAN